MGQNNGHVKRGRRNLPLPAAPGNARKSACLHQGDAMSLPSPRPIAFYAPLKPPDHGVPSGDRLMARQLVSVLGSTGTVILASRLRSFLRDPQDLKTARTVAEIAASEIARLDAEWRAAGPPALWFCYHPYYKSPDLIGPTLCRRFNLPYVTAESSYSARRNIGLWADAQAGVLAGIHQADVNICLTRRDEQGLRDSAPGARLARLAPFIDTAPFTMTPSPEPNHLITVAMMRAGDKSESYAFLAAALSRITDLPWRLSVIGDGDERAAIHRLFAPVSNRLNWLGALPTAAIAPHLSRASLYLWPGIGEAYGLAYLEAQAAGLPVLAQNIAGVPEVVAQGVTGVLTSPGDVPAYAAALRELLTDTPRRDRLAAQTRPQINEHHSMNCAANRLCDLLLPFLKGAT